MSLHQKLRDATLNRSAPTPLWYQLKKVLQTHIEKDLRAGDLLPPERELATAYGLSVITVRRALDELTKDGRVKREQGRGTYVLPPRFEEGPHQLTGFTEEMSTFGLTTSSRVLDYKVIAVPSWLISKLGLPRGAKAICLSRLRFAGDLPMAVQRAYLPAQLLPGFKVEELGTGSLYSYLGAKYGLEPTEAHEVHYADPVTSDEAKLLGLSAGSPGLRAERLTVGTNDKARTVFPIEFVHSIMRGDKYRVHLELKRST